MKERIIGSAVVGVLTIAGVMVGVSHQEVSDKYYENTGKELNIVNDDLISFDEVIKTAQSDEEFFQEYYDDTQCEYWDEYVMEEDRVEYYYYDSKRDCDREKDVLLKNLVATKNYISCFTQAQVDDIPKSTLNFCIETMDENIETSREYSEVLLGECDRLCESDIEAMEYNKAMFQVFLEKSK